MSEAKIYPVWPWFETKDHDGLPVKIVAYRAKPGHAGLWHGFLGAYDGWRLDCWVSNTKLLATQPEIPPEAREPKPGEIWRESSTRPAMVLEWRGDYYRCLVPICGDYHVWPLKREELKSPWPADEPHYFERLIEAIRGTET